MKIILNMFPGVTFLDTFPGVFFGRKAFPGAKESETVDTLIQHNDGCNYQCIMYLYLSSMHGVLEPASKYQYVALVPVCSKILLMVIYPRSLGGDLV